MATLLEPGRRAVLLPPRMTILKHLLYESENGDRWFLAGDISADRLFIRHEANAASGGHVREIDIGVFLREGENGPEHQALRQLVRDALAQRT